MYIYVLDLFGCLFGVYRSTREFFTHIMTSPLPVKGCQFGPIPMLGTHGPTSGKGSLACHTDCDIGHPFLMVIF